MSDEARRVAFLRSYFGRPLTELEWRRAVEEDWADFDRPCEALRSRDPGAS